MTMTDKQKRLLFGMAALIIGIAAIVYGMMVLF